MTVITISGFSTSDNGGTIQCINIEDGGVQGMADISVGESLCMLGYVGMCVRRLFILLL